MLKDVGGVGQRGKIIEVSDGYALNYLIPHRFAEQPTAEQESEVQRRMQSEDATRAKEAAANRAIVEGLRGQEIKLAAKSTEKGGLFKAVSAMDIAKAVMTQRGVMLRVASIILETPIKTIGEHPVTIRSGDAEAVFTLKVQSN